MEREKEAKAEQEQQRQPHKIRGRRGAVMMAALSTATVTPSAAGGARPQPNCFPLICCAARCRAVLPLLPLPPELGAALQRWALHC
eukprot:2874998-Rhodomonas_salina.1